MDRRFSLALIVLVLIGGSLWLAFGPPNAVPPPAPQPAEPAPGPAVPEQSYVLAISWEPAFCEGASGKPECRSQRAGREDADHFSLHGLWPAAEYCGVSSRHMDDDQAGNWYALPEPELSATTAAALDKAMPGTQSDLQRHEWLKHGTCTGADADRYFRRAVELLGAINASAVRELFAGNVGRSITRGDIRAAFDAAFGTGAGSRVRITCNRDGGRFLVTELTIGLDGDVLGNAPIGRLIAAAGSTGGGCDTGTVDPVGLQ